MYSVDPRFHVHFCVEQTRLLMVYFLLTLNIPSVIIWSKSLKSNEIKPLYTMMPDSGFEVALLSIVLHVFKCLKKSFKLMIFDMGSEVLACLVLVNSVLTILYASVSLYRLQYFILVHLLIMSFNSIKPGMLVEGKSKKD